MSVVGTSGLSRACRLKENVPHDLRYPPTYTRLLLEQGGYVWMKENGGYSNPKDPSNIWVSVRTAYDTNGYDAETEGVVPFKCLELGAYEGSISTTVFKPFDSAIHVNFGAPSLFQRTLEALLYAIGSDRARLYYVGLRERHLVRLENESASLAQAIVTYMPPEIFDILKDGLVSAPGSPQDTFERLWLVPNRLQVKAQVSGGGDYLNLYRQALRNAISSFLNAWYVGQTVNFGDRYRQHRNMIESAQEPTYAISHYRLARQCYQCYQSGSGWRAIKMIEIPANLSDDDKKDISTIAEQALILMLHATNRSLLKVRSVEEISLRGPFFQTATALQEVCQRVFTEVGWQVRMASVTGANWSMPLAELDRYSEKALWTRVLVPPSPHIDANTQKAIFSRQPSRISDKAFAGKDRFRIRDAGMEYAVSDFL